jgi:hypothetical protein
MLAEFVLASTIDGYQRLTLIEAFSHLFQWRQTPVRSQERTFPHFQAKAMGFPMAAASTLSFRFVPPLVFCFENLRSWTFRNVMSFSIHDSRFQLFVPPRF